MELEELILKRGVGGVPSRFQKHRGQPCGVLLRFAGRNESRALVSWCPSQEETPLQRV